MRTIIGIFVIISIFLYSNINVNAQNSSDNIIETRALSKNELLRLIKETNTEIKNWQVVYMGEWEGTKLTGPYTKILNEPVIFYGKTKNEKEDYELLKNLPVNYEKLIRKSVFYYNGLTYYTINPLEYGLRDVDYTNFRYYMVVLNNRIKNCESKIKKLNAQKDSLQKSQYDKKWFFTGNEKVIYNGVNFIPLSNQYSSQSWKYSKYKLMFSYLQNQLQNKEFDFEINFKGKYLKTNSKNKYVKVGLKLLVENYHLTEYSVNSSFDKKVIGKEYHTFKIKKEDGYLYLFCDGNQLEKIDIYSGAECSNLMLFGNNFAVRDLEIKIINSKHNLDIYNSELLKCNKTIEDVLIFFKDYKAAVSISKASNEYFLLCENIPSQTPSVKDIENAEKFIEKYPDFIASNELSRIINAGSAVNEIDKIIASNLSARDKFWELNKINTTGWQLEKYKESVQETLFPEIQESITKRVDSIINTSETHEMKIRNLVGCLGEIHLNGCEREAGGEEIVLDGISKLLIDKTSKIVKSKNNLTNKILTLSAFLNGLQNGATLSKEYDESLNVLKSLGQKTIKSTVSMYYKTVERTEPLVTHREVRDESDIIDALFRQKNYVEYTWTTGGNTYNDITGYEIKGTIKNLSSKTIVVKARSHGSLKSSGNGLVDIGRAFSAAILHKDKFDWEEKEYTIPAGGAVNYKLSGGCSHFAKMSVRFKVIKVGNAWIDN